MHPEAIGVHHAMDGLHMPGRRLQHCAAQWCTIRAKLLTGGSLKDPSLAVFTRGTAVGVPPSGTARRWT